MNIIKAGNYIWFNILLLVLVACFIVLMPLCDRFICKKLGINTEHGISSNEHSAQLLIRRKIFLYLVFAFYLLMVLYLVFFSRVAADEYKIHVDPLSDIAGSIHLDDTYTGLGELLKTEGVLGIFRHIVIEKYDIYQAELNILLFVPFGYLLPYIFDWFKKNIWRTFFVGFALSFSIENLQLIFKRGFYDFDDLIFNTLGALIGAIVFNRYAFMVTNPSWKKNLIRFYHFRKRAKNTVLFPSARDAQTRRITLFASSEEAIHEFYVEKLGFFLQGQYVSLESEFSSLLLKLGDVYVEFLCANKEEEIQPQLLQIQVRNLNRVVKALERNGITVSEEKQDFYNHRKYITIEAPDHVQLLISE